MVHTISREVDCLYLPRTLGSRGFTSLFDVVEFERWSQSTYLYCTSNSLLQCARNVLQIQVVSTVDEFVAEAH